MDVRKILIFKKFHKRLILGSRIKNAFYMYSSKCLKNICILFKNCFIINTFETKRNNY